MPRIVIEDPVLGPLQQSMIGWEGVVEQPDLNFLEVPRKQSSIALLVHDPSQPPSAIDPGLLETARSICTPDIDPLKLAARALWDDLMGDGPASGTWWHGALRRPGEAVAFERLVSVRSQSDLIAAVSAVCLHVYRLIDSRLIYEVQFDAPWEREHGVGVICRGKSAIGVGYYLQGRLFDTSAAECIASQDPFKHKLA